MPVSLSEIARALRGKVVGNQVLAPGPNHSAKDQSLSVRLSAGSPDGFIVFSHAGDDWRACREYVAGALGLPSDRWRQDRPVDPAEDAKRQRARRQIDEDARAEAIRRQRFALAIWNAAGEPRGTAVEVYLQSRGLSLPDDIAVTTLRFHASCPWERSAVPAMVAALRDVHSGEIVGVHRTGLTAAGKKIGRKMFGSASAAAVMLDASETVTTGLTIGEGIESCLAARQLGIKPTWAVGSTTGIAAFPVLPGIEILTVLGEQGCSASASAAEVVGTRWHRAGRSVDIVTPKVGKDMNDALLGGVAA